MLPKSKKEGEFHTVELHDKFSSFSSDIRGPGTIREHNTAVNCKKKKKKKKSVP